MPFQGSLKMIGAKLRQLWLVSSLAVVTILLAAAPPHAHEVRPAIADFDVKATEVTLDIRVMLEALLADIDLSGVANTDEAENAKDYTAFRAMPAPDLTAIAQEAWPDLGATMIIMAGETRIPAQLVAINVPQVGNVDLPRDSHLILRADLPNDGSAVQLGWAPENGPLVLRQNGPLDTAYTGYLDAGDLSPPIPRDGLVEQSFLSVVTDYIVIGFEHILPKGLDHILFVLGLFFFSLALRPMLIQITMFTLAHTVTLALGALGVVAINPAIVEPLIAASIAFVAIENVLTTKMQPWRPVVIFGFGLLHGLGFASMLNDIGLSNSYFVTSLISFNVGVEIGQLTVISLAFLLLGVPLGRKSWWRKGVQIPASLLISAVAIYWVIERTVLA